MAADHNGCLPLVFDDAFANSDPERTQTLQRMLDLAASHQLQIIVLTCNPSDYATLGARQVLLRAENVAVSRPLAETDNASPAAAAVSDDVDQSSVAAAVTTIGDEQRQQLISCLRELGGKSGNLALRRRLGWDEATYNEVKEAMMASGVLITNKGRGGSVTLLETDQPSE